MNAQHKPSVLFVYFTYTQQTLKVVEAMSEVLQRRGWDVHRALIEFDDPRYAKRFETFPMPRPFLEVLGMIPAELRRRPAKIGIPATVTEQEYDLVVIGSPTWWLSTNVPIRSFLESDVAASVLDQRALGGLRSVPPLLEAQLSRRSRGLGPSWAESSSTVSISDTKADSCGRCCP